MTDEVMARIKALGLSAEQMAQLDGWGQSHVRQPCQAQRKQRASLPPVDLDGFMAKASRQEQEEAYSLLNERRVIRRGGEQYASSWKECVQRMISEKNIRPMIFSGMDYEQYIRVFSPDSRKLDRYHCLCFSMEGWSKYAKCFWVDEVVFEYAKFMMKKAGIA